MVVQTLVDKCKAVSNKSIVVFLFLFLFLLAFLRPLPSWADVNNIDISATVTGGSGPPPPGYGGSGVFLPIPNPLPVPTDITFSGLAYPNAKVILLYNGIQSLETTADSQALFSFKLGDLSPGIKIFSIVAEDPEGVRSILLTIPISILDKTSTNIANLFIPPTLTSDRISYVRGDQVLLHGYSVPGSLVTTVLDSIDGAQISADVKGLYNASLDTRSLLIADHTAQLKSQISTSGVSGAAKSKSSGLSKLLTFFIVLTRDQNITDKADLAKLVDVNGDGVVNIVDFSILAYWYEKPSPPKNLDFNGDGRVTIADFSILAYYWNG